MRLLLLAAALLVPLAGLVVSGASPRLLGACGDEAPPVAVTGFAPVSMADGPVLMDSTGFSCYRLFHEPSFGYHGSIVITLSDGVNTAEYRATYMAAGVVPEEIVTNRAPELLPGLLELRGEGYATEADVLAVGTWGGGAVLGFAP